MLNSFLLSVSLSYVVACSFVFFFFKQKTAYEMRISDWSSDVCSSDLAGRERHLCPARFLNGGEASGRSFIGRSEMRSSAFAQPFRSTFQHDAHGGGIGPKRSIIFRAHQAWIEVRSSEEHMSELQSLMRISYAVFRSKKTTTTRSALPY